MEHSIKSDEPAFFHDQMIGKLAVNYKLISSEDYIEAVNLQKSGFETGMASPLMEVLIQHDFLTRDEIDMLKQVKDMLTEMRKEKRFGVIAVKHGFISESELTRALNTQSREKKNIGLILMESGILTGEQCRRILEIQNSIVVKLPSLSDIQKASRAAKTETVSLSDSMAPSILNVSDDELTAVIALPPGNGKVRNEDIYALLRKNGINSGIISDRQINEYLKLRPLGLNSFIVARGQKSVAGVAGELTLKFTPRKLTAGKVDKNGKIDFKERGKIPFAKKGDLLAELGRMRQSRPGVTVYGKEIHIDQVEDIFASINGTGTILDETSGKIYAEHDGEPCVMTDGSLCVYQEVRVDDVDFGSGNIAFEGNIIVSGKVNDGFKVEGHHVSAAEITGACIVAEGNLTVSGGITGADIIAGGTVRAAYIKDSSISSLGEVLCTREIVNSVIETSGTCRVSGNIISSKVTAGKGIQADNIGSRTSKPNFLQVGSLTSAIRIISENEESHNSVETALSDLLNQSDTISEKITTTKNAIQETDKELSTLEKALNDLKMTIRHIEKKSGTTVKTAQKQTEELRKKITASRDTLKNLKEERHRYESLLTHLGSEIRKKREEKSKVNSKIARLTEWMIQNQANAMVRAVKNIFADTRIESANASTTLKKDYFNVTIREIKKPLASGNCIAPQGPAYRFEIIEAQKNASDIKQKNA